MEMNPQHPLHAYPLCKESKSMEYQSSPKEQSRCSCCAVPPSSRRRRSPPHCNNSLSPNTNTNCSSPPRQRRQRSPMGHHSKKFFLMCSCLYLLSVSTAAGGAAADLGEEKPPTKFLRSGVPTPSPNNNDNDLNDMAAAADEAASIEGDDLSSKDYRWWPPLPSKKSATTTDTTADEAAAAAASIYSARNNGHPKTVTTKSNGENNSPNKDAQVKESSGDEGVGEKQKPFSFLGHYHSKSMGSDVNAAATPNSDEAAAAADGDGAPSIDTDKEKAGEGVPKREAATAKFNSPTAAPVTAAPIATSANLFNIKKQILANENELQREEEELARLEEEESETEALVIEEEVAAPIIAASANLANIQKQIRDNEKELQSEESELARLKEEVSETEASTTIAASTNLLNIQKQIRANKKELARLEEEVSDYATEARVIQEENELPPPTAPPVAASANLFNIKSQILANQKELQSDEEELARLKEETALNEAVFTEDLAREKNQKESKQELIMEELARYKRNQVEIEDREEELSRLADTVSEEEEMYTTITEDVQAEGGGIESSIKDMMKEELARLKQNQRELQDEEYEISRLAGQVSEGEGVYSTVRDDLEQQEDFDYETYHSRHHIPVPALGATMMRTGVVNRASRKEEVLDDSDAGGNVKPPPAGILAFAGTNMAMKNYASRTNTDEDDDDELPMPSNNNNRAMMFQTTLASISLSRSTMMYGSDAEDDIGGAAVPHHFPGAAVGGLGAKYTDVKPKMAELLSQTLKRELENERILQEEDEEIARLQREEAQYRAMMDSDKPELSKVLFHGLNEGIQNQLSLLEAEEELARLKDRVSQEMELLDEEKEVARLRNLLVLKKKLLPPTPSDLDRGRHLVGLEVREVRSHQQIIIDYEGNGDVVDDNDEDESSSSSFGIDGLDVEHVVKPIRVRFLVAENYQAASIMAQLSGANNNDGNKTAEGDDSDSSNKDADGSSPLAQDKIHKTKLYSRLLFKLLSASFNATSELYSTLLSLRSSAVVGPIMPTVSTCGAATIPLLHQEQGVGNADILIYVSGDNTFCGGSVLYSAICDYDQHMRPLVANINICTKNIPTEVQTSTLSDGTPPPSTTISDKIDMSLMTIHDYTTYIVTETSRVLGASTSLFRHYQNPDTNSPYGTSIKHDVNCIDGTAESSIPVPNVIGQEVDGEGQVYYEIRTPKVIEVVRNHFDCMTLTGARLEARRKGGVSCFGGFLDEHLFFGEQVSAFQTIIATQGSQERNDHQPANGISPFTLALLEDSSWYIANYTMSTESSFGRGAGCEFARRHQGSSNDCAMSPRNDTSRHDTAMSSVQESYYCSEIGSMGCDITHSFKAQCDLLNQQTSPASHAVSPIGRNDDVCPMYVRGAVDCSNEGDSSVNIPGEVYGEGSKCFLTDEGQPICLQGVCNKKTQMIDIYHEGSVFVCKHDGQIIDTKTIRIQCPRIAAICPHLICPSNCSGRGVCDEDRDGKHTCICDDPFDETPGCWG